MADGTVGITHQPQGDRQIDNVVMPNAAGVVVHRQRVAVGPVLYREIRDYAGRSDNNPVYVGFAAQEADTDSAVWVVHRRSYDALTNRLLDTQVAVGIAWSDRTAAVHWRSVGGD